MSNIEELEKLAILKKNGVISDAEFETQKKFLLNDDEQEKKVYFPEMTKERILFAIVLLGVFSVLAGLGLIIAANWDSIPPMLKVALGLGSLASSLVATTIFERNGKSRWREVFLFVSFLLIGGNIALLDKHKPFKQIFRELVKCNRSINLYDICRLCFFQHLKRIRKIVNVDILLHLVFYLEILLAYFDNSTEISTFINQQTVLTDFS